MQALLALTLDFGAAYAAEKRRRSLVDFSDLEHMTAQLLTDDDGAPTELARQLSGRYTEIMVDEYQDVSEVQDSSSAPCRAAAATSFFVGDVKQSIYRFRLADPTIFLDKYARFADFREAAPGAPRRILLRENFRSRRAVLEAANHVFSNIMSRALGELDYDDAARLRAGASYPGDGEKPELAVLELPDADDDAPTPEKAALEADYVARRIRALIDGGAPVGKTALSAPRTMATRSSCCAMPTASALCTAPRSRRMASPCRRRRAAGSTLRGGVGAALAAGGGGQSAPGRAAHRGAALAAVRPDGGRSGRRAHVRPRA